MRHTRLESRPTSPNNGKTDHGPLKPQGYNHVGIDTDVPDAPRIRRAVERSDWSEIRYSRTVARVDGLTHALATLRDAGSRRARPLAKYVRAHAYSGRPVMLLSAVANQIDAVESAHGRYRWVGFDSHDDDGAT